MKKWVKVVLTIVTAIVLVGGLIIAAVFHFTAGMVDSADAFFTAVKQKDMAKARTYLAEDFKASSDEKALTEFLSKSALLNFKESSWSNRQINNGRGDLDGSITTESGGVVPVKISFVKENEEWKIYAIQKPTAGLQTEASSEDSPVATPSIPSKAEQIVLVKQATHDFLISIEKKDMSHFYGTLSALWKKQVTIEELNQAFKGIIDSGANWSALETVEPDLPAEATIDQDGVLALIAHYSIKSEKVQVKQKYIYEGTAWKLLGFSIKTE